MMMFAHGAVGAGRLQKTGWSEAYKARIHRHQMLSTSNIYNRCE